MCGGYHACILAAFWFFQVMQVTSDEEIRAVFSDEDAMDLLLGTGFRNPINSLLAQDKEVVISTLKDYYCITKVRVFLLTFFYLVLSGEG